MSILISFLVIFFAIIVFASIGLGIYSLVIGIKNKRIGLAIMSVVVLAIGITGFTFIFFYSTFAKVFGNVI